MTKEELEIIDKAFVYGYSDSAEKLLNHVRRCREAGLSLDHLAPHLIYVKNCMDKVVARLEMRG